MSRYRDRDRDALIRLLQFMHLRKPGEGLQSSGTFGVARMRQA